MVDQHYFEVITATTDVSSLQVLAPAVKIPAEEFLFGSGWGKTCAHGMNYGRNYIEPFKAEILLMFNAVKDDSAKKLGPGRMLAELKRRYPTCLDLPSESEIRAFISGLLEKHNKGKDTTVASNSGV